MPDHLLFGRSRHAFTKTCSACGRPLKTGFMANGKVVTEPSCKSPVCPKFGQPS